MCYEFQIYRPLSEQDMDDAKNSSFVAEHCVRMEALKLGIDKEYYCIECNALP